MDLHGIESQAETAVEESIIHSLPEITVDKAREIARELVQMGLHSKEDLCFVEEKDLTPFLLPIQARKLLAGLKNASGAAHDISLPVPESREPLKALLPQPSTRNVQPASKEWNFSVDWEDIYKIDSQLKARLEKGKKITKRYRTKMVERVVTQVRNKVPHATRKIFLQVTAEMKAKYPRSFRHELANGKLGKGSFGKTMQDKFDNDKRPKKKTVMETEAPAIKAAYGCKKWKLASLPANETPLTQETKIKKLAEIFESMRPSAWDWEEINQIMDATYGTLRKEINKQAEVIEKQKRRINNEEQQEDDPEEMYTAALREKWPFLFHARGMLHHFKFLTGVDMREKMNHFLQSGEMEKMLQFLSATDKKNKKIKKKMDRALKRDDGATLSPYLAGLLLMLANHFGEDLNDVVKIVDPATQEEDVCTECVLPCTPLLIVAGASIFKGDRFFFSMDETLLGSAPDLKEGLMMVFAAYYVFNIVYAPRAQIILEYIQRCIADINPARGNKRCNKVTARAKGGKFSSTQVHSKLVAMNRKYEDFFADQDSSTTENTNSSN